MLVIPFKVIPFFFLDTSAALSRTKKETNLPAGRQEIKKKCEAFTNTFEKH